MPLVPTVEVFLDTLERIIREDGYLDWCNLSGFPTSSFGWTDKKIGISDFSSFQHERFVALNKQNGRDRLIKWKINDGLCYSTIRLVLYGFEQVLVIL